MPRVLKQGSVTRLELYFWCWALKSIIIHKYLSNISNIIAKYSLNILLHDCTLAFCIFCEKKHWNVKPTIFFSFFGFSCKNFQAYFLFDPPSPFSPFKHFFFLVLSSFSHSNGHWIVFFFNHSLSLSHTHTHTPLLGEVNNEKYVAVLVA